MEPVTVLLIDDSQVVCKRVAAMLAATRRMTVVGTAGTVREGLEMVRQFNPDCLVLDINLPDGNGLQVLRAVREQGLPVAVVVMSNHNHPHYRDLCLELGADCFLDKAMEFDRVVQVLLERVPSKETDSRWPLPVREHATDWNCLAWSKADRRDSREANIILN